MILFTTVSSLPFPQPVPAAREGVLTHARSTAGGVEKVPMLGSHGEEGRAHKLSLISTEISPVTTQLDYRARASAQKQKTQEAVNNVTAPCWFRNGFAVKRLEEFSCERLRLASSRFGWSQPLPERGERSTAVEEL